MNTELSQQQPEESVAERYYRKHIEYLKRYQQENRRKQTERVKKYYNDQKEKKSDVYQRILKRRRDYYQNVQRPKYLEVRKLQKESSLAKTE